MRHFYTPPLFSGPASEFREDLDTHKTRMNGLSCGEESMTMFSRFDTVPASDGRTNRRTDGQTDGRPAYIYYTCFSI